MRDAAALAGGALLRPLSYHCPSVGLPFLTWVGWWPGSFSLTHLSSSSALSQLHAALPYAALPALVAGPFSLHPLGRALPWPPLQETPLGSLCPLGASLSLAEITPQTQHTSTTGH